MLGDCYYLSVLAALAEKPNRIEKLIKMDKTTANGVWTVQLYKNGVRRTVTMNPSIPCIGSGPCFAHANGNELWVIMLEKAYAAIHGSYAKIVSGIGSEAMRDLTGAPSDVLHVSKETDLMAKLL